MKLFLLTRSSGNFGTVVFAVIAQGLSQAKEVANSHYPPPRVTPGYDFYKVEECPIRFAEVLYSENNE